MKVYISVDIEGIAGISHWDEALDNGSDYATFRTFMTNEALAAIEGARAGGATRIVLRDAHETGRNMDIARIPDDVTLIRGWSGHPFKMIQHLDDSFAALVMIGWHGAAGNGGNPLAHTMTGRFADITLNGEPMSEFLIHAHLAATCRVPVVFLAGDDAICTQARALNPAMGTVATKTGHGASITGITPARSCRLIADGVAAALQSNLRDHALPQADTYVMDLRFTHPHLAHAKSYYPGARMIADDTLRFEHDDIYEIARALGFM
ncbi:M55 family metallopeptidase [Oceaniglobus indicus]|uniref:M55 family metallopeptidase n=1 Tax=Oceaniglobus indicus TaxID=2047749 RepID=UPI00130450D6|nr:M55 family metallopeptidase [Oceaniglobus indicus]